MLNVVHEKEKIRAFQKEFEEILMQETEENILCQVGHMGWSEEYLVNWSSNLGLWTLSRKLKNRYWNAFGVKKPREGRGISITGEINFPLNGIDRKIAAAFVEDGLGGVYIIHRGKIGGGKKGVGKELFKNSYTGEWVKVNDGGKESEVALIGALKSKNFPSQVREFIFEIDRIKEKANGKDLNENNVNLVFEDEFFGVKRYTTKQKIEAQCNHGLIVNRLAEHIENLGGKVGNDRNRDLYIVNKDRKITSIFEVKTDISSSSIYSAIGQLLLNSIILSNKPKLYLVVPLNPKPALKEKLNNLGIEIVTFSMTKKGIEFPKINFR